MKKQFVLFAIATTLMCACAFSLKSKPANVIYAEGEETSEPELISSEEPAMSSFEEEEPSSEPAEEPKESVIKKIETFRDTFLVPLLSGISVTTIVSLAVSVALAMKNRHTNKEMAAENKSTQTLALEAINKSTELLGKALEILEKVDNQLNEQTAREEAFIGDCNARVDALVKEVGILREDMQALFEMKECLLLLASIQTEMAKADPQIVSSGVVEKIALLNARVKEMQGE